MRYVSQVHPIKHARHPLEFLGLIPLALAVVQVNRTIPEFTGKGSPLILPMTGIQSYVLSDKNEKKGMDRHSTVAPATDCGNPPDCTSSRPVRSEISLQRGTAARSTL
ncbi:hypothetical protein PsorP6_005640 [Peronosclerospora sorghi]|uniref:Uncharacterized protein n=1 Tax=Peronosclerospora sorghi TaxID=230839 RepID=A0ACC0W560_9STRA|nr:hypothetical protein PsorP6_005640 [Peronosclerospora sorghi]